MNSLIKIKNIVCLLMLIFTGQVISAQQSDKAKEILEEVSKKTQSYSTISADFSYSMVNADEDINEGYTGSIILEGKKYNIQIGDIGLTMVSDGSTVWSYMKDANQVTISTVDDESTEIMDPSKIFTIYEEGFKFNYIGEKTEDGKSVYNIDLLPDSEDMDFTKISISINKADMMIHSAVMADGTGTLYKIKVTKLDLNKPVDESLFTFDTSKYKDIEVVDFR